MSEAAQKPVKTWISAPAGNTATGLLKLIALVFMFIDHSGKVLFNNMAEMRILGRIAFPLYIWCMIVGFHRTRSVPGYMARVALVGLISQPLYAVALNVQGNLGILLSDMMKPLAGGFTWEGLGQVFYTFYLQKPNIFLSLLLGLGALWGIRENRFLSRIWAPAAAIALATVLNADYGWRGVTLFILMYAAQGYRPALAGVMIAFFLFWGTGFGVTRSLFGIDLNISSLPAWISAPLGSFLRLETYALLSLPRILIRFSRDVRVPKWISYSLYPAHLVLLILLKLIIFGL